MALISLGLMAGKALSGGMSSRKAARPQAQQTKISSSTFRPQRATSQKIPKTTSIGGYGIGGISKNTFILTPQSNVSGQGTILSPQSNVSGQGTLAETNRILVDIQNLLAADFAYRIASEKQIEKKIRADTEKKRRSRREALLEGGRKIGRATSSVISKVTAPAISFLDRVFDFLGAVFEGFLASKALKWLSEKENQQKVENVFKFIGKNWKILLGIASGLIGGVVVAKVISKLYRMYKITRGLLRLLGIGRGRGRRGDGDTLQDGGRPGRGGLFRRADGSRRGVKVFQTTKEFSRRSALGGSVKYTKNVIGRSKNPLAKLLQFAQVKIIRSASKFFRKSGLKLLTKALRPFLKGIPIIGALLDFGLSLALGESVGRAGAKAVGALLGGIVGSALGPVGSFGGAVAGDMLGAALFDMFTGGQANGMNSGGIVPGGQANGMNSGGIVPGGGPNKDSVFAYLTPGEGVVPRDMMNDKMFGPFVKDIIYNSGSLYGDMVFALRKLEFSSDAFLEVNKKFGEILDDYTNTLKDSSQSVKPSPSIKPTPPSKPPISSPPKITTGGLTQDTQSGEGTMGQIVLPTLNFGDTTQQSSKNIPIDNSFAKYGPIDISNPYLAYVKKEFGILGG